MRATLIENCVTLEEALEGNNNACAEGKLPENSDNDDGPDNDGKPDLSIEKSCKPGVLGGLISCRIAIRNNGTRTPSGVIRIFDVARVIGTNAPLVAQDVTPDGPEWSCEGAPANDLACMIDGSHLTPGTTRYFEAKIELTGKGNQRYRNCATAHHEPVEGGDMTMIGQSCVEGGVDIRVEKTGPARCELDQPCTFDVTIKNVGETDFSGLVKIADALGQGLAPAGINVPISNISPPLPCDVQPTQVPFVCTGTLNLAAGESVTHQITLTFDIETELEGGNTLRNCAGVIDGNLAADKKQLGNKNQEPMAESDIVGCHSFEVGEDADKGDQCTPPMVLNNNGVCVCPDGTRWNGRRCVGADPIPPVVPEPEQLCKPGKGEVRTSNNRCVCRAGYIRKGPDLCVPPSTGCKPGRNEYKTRKGKCVCKPGYVRNDYGICTKPQTCKPGRNEVKDRYGNCVCRKGYSRDNNGYCVKLPPLCKLGPNEFRNSQGQCVCKSGYKRGKRGICVKIPDGCKPGRNEYKNAKGQCVCKKGYDRNNYGQCVKIPPLCKPKRNEIRNSKGQCVCISGYQRNKKGICVKIPTNCKKPNEVKNSKGQCVCKKGYDRNNYGICTKTPTCKPGKNEYRDKNGRCVCKRGFKRNSKGHMRETDTSKTSLFKWQFDQAR